MAVRIMKKKASLEKAATYLQKMRDTLLKKVESKEKNFFDDLRELKKNWTLVSHHYGLYLRCAGRAIALSVQLGEEEDAGKLKLAISDFSLQRMVITNSRDDLQEIFVDLRVNGGEKRKADGEKKKFIDAVGFQEIHRLVNQIQYSIDQSYVYRMVPTLFLYIQTQFVYFGEKLESGIMRNRNRGMHIFPEGIFVRGEEETFLKLVPVTNRRIEADTQKNENPLKGGYKSNYFKLMEIFLLAQKKKIMSLSEKSELEKTQLEAGEIFVRTLSFNQLRTKIQRRVLSLLSSLPPFNFKWYFLTRTSCEWSVQFKE